jgi:hypothetical protein
METHPVLTKTDHHDYGKHGPRHEAFGKDLCKPFIIDQLHLQGCCVDCCRLMNIITNLTNKGH